MRRDGDFGSKIRKKWFALEAQGAERGWVGFSSTTMACIYSLGDAMVDLPKVMRSDQLWKQIVVLKIEETVHKEFGSVTDEI
jgi:hypothetical protein